MGGFFFLCLLGIDIGKGVVFSLFCIAFSIFYFGIDVVLFIFAWDESCRLFRENFYLGSYRMEGRCVRRLCEFIENVVF